MSYTESDVNAAANTEIKDIFAELRDSSAKLKISAILIGSLLPKIQKDKSYKEKGYKSYNDYITSLGLSIEMANNLTTIATALEQKFPEAYKRICAGEKDSYLPSKKAMNLASQIDKPTEEFIKPVGVMKLKKMAELARDRDDSPKEISIEKLVKSSKTFTKKVTECDTVPDKLKNDMLAINSKLQELNP